MGRCRRWPTPPRQFGARSTSWPRCSISVDAAAPGSQSEADGQAARLSPFLRWSVTALCAAYSAVVLVLLFQPDAGVPADGSNLVPFRSVRLQLRNGFTRQLIGNTLLLAPIGFALRIWGVRLATIAFAMLGLSVGIELAQVLVDRISDVDDVLLNVAGGVLGGAIGGGFVRLVARSA